MVVAICCYKIRSLISEITVEPVLFLYMLATFAQYAIFQDLIYSRVCLEKYNGTICEELHSHNFSSDLHEENEALLDYVQKTSSHWVLLATLSTIIPSIFISIYLGSWSDRFGRKWPVAIPPLGGIFGCLVYVLISFEEEIPLGWICFASFLPGLTGGFVSCMMSCATYISSATTDEQRTVRLSRLEAMTFLGGTIGPFASGSLLPLFGHGYAFIFMTLCYMVAFIYVVIFVQDISGSFQIEQDDKTNTSSTNSSERESIFKSDSPYISPTSRESPTKSLNFSDVDEETTFLKNSNKDSFEDGEKIENCCGRYFGSEHFVHAVTTCCKKREGGRRKYILLVIFAGFITMIITAGELDVGFLFARDKPLMWGPQLYSYYFGFKYGIGFFVLMVAMPIFQKLKLSDASICIIGLISRMAGLVCYGFSTTTTIAFIGPLAAIFSFFSIPAIRALLSKLVHPNEQGRMFSFVAIVEDICTLSASAIFNSLYPLTRKIFHGFMFQLAAFLLIIPILIMCYIQRSLRDFDEKIIPGGGEIFEKNEGKVRNSIVPIIPPSASILIDESLGNIKLSI